MMGDALKKTTAVCIKDLYAKVSQTVLALRGSNGVGIKDLWLVRGSPPIFVAIYCTWWHLPSKTHRKKNEIFKELLHLSWEVFNFWGSSLASGLVWPQDGLGQGRLRLKWAKGRFWSKNDEKVKVLRMGLPIVENLSGPQESIFSISRSPQLGQLHFDKRFKKMLEFY